MNTKVEIDAEIRQEHIKRSYEAALEKIEYLVLATPTGKAREDLTTARMYLEKAKRNAGRSRA